MPSPTAVVPWQRLYNDLKISIPGVTDAVMKQEMFRCAKDFFDMTNIWTEDVPFVVDPSNLSYQVTPAGKGVPNRLIVVFDPLVYPQGTHWVQSGIEMQVPGTIVLMYAPSSSANWVATYAKNVTDPADVNGFPDIDTGSYWIIDKYRDAFYYGTMALLQRQPAKTYSNANEGVRNHQYYITQRGKARTDALKANVYGGQRWMYPQSYATVSRKGWA